MNLETIVKMWLTENGYDGLRNPNGECACKIGDLAPCESDCLQCEPGHLVEAPPDGDFVWQIVPGKRPATKLGPGWSPL